MADPRGPRARTTCVRALVLAAFGLLSGCDGAPGRDTQVAARVNEGEISVHQVQQALKQQPELLGQHGEAAARVALDNLVEQELAAQAAVEAGLDKDPAVIQSLEAVKRETLARAYQDRLANRATEPEAQAVDAYYDAHPERFRDRRLYSIQEFRIKADARQGEAVRSLSQSSQTLAQFEQGLRALRLSFSTRPLLMPTEAVPTSIRAELQALQVGRGLLVERDGVVHVAVLVDAQDFALDRRAARPVIEAELLAQRRRERVEQGMKPLRQAARIAHQGKFAQAPSPPGAASSP